MTKRCFDTVWRQRRSRNRRKTVLAAAVDSSSFQKLSRKPRSGKCDSGRKRQLVIHGRKCVARGGRVEGRCGRLLISMWTSVASISRAVSLGEVRAWRSGLTCVRVVTWQTTTTEKQTGSQRVHLFFPTSLRLCRYTCGHLFSLLKWKQKRFHDFLNFVSSEERTDLREKALRLSADIAAKHCCIHWI